MSLLSVAALESLRLLGYPAQIRVDGRDVLIDVLVPNRFNDSLGYKTVTLRAGGGRSLLSVAARFIDEQAFGEVYEYPVCG